MRRASIQMSTLVTSFTYSIKHLWTASKGSLILLIPLDLISSQFTIVYAWVQARVIDSAVDSISLRPNLVESRLFTPLAMLGGYLFAQHFYTRLRAGTFGYLSYYSGCRLQLLLMDSLATRQVADLEDPNKQNQIYMAYSSSSAVSEYPFQFMGLARSCLTLVTILVALFTFDPFLAVLILLTSLPSFITYTRYAISAFNTNQDLLPHQRMISYVSSLFLRPPTAREVRVYGLVDFFKEKAEFAQNMAWLRRAKQVLGSSKAYFWVGILSSSAYVAGMAFLLQATAQSRITIGQLTFYSSLLLQTQGLLLSSASSVASIVEASLHVEQFRTLVSVDHSPSVGDAEPLSEPPEIEFRGVTFRYGQGPNVLSNVTFHISPGEHISIVGPNGSGKSTLAKLLLGLYRPTEGEILINGKSLNQIPMASYLAAVALLDQDFGRYDLTVRENVGMGRLKDMNKTSLLAKAADLVGIWSKVERLPQGIDSMLGTLFSGGSQLSPGEWQKLALARAYFRNAKLLILDEPSSHLDPLQEASLLQTYSEGLSDKTVLFISHRLSTARFCDRVIVLRSGTVAEIGNHKQLLDFNGVYSTMYQTQAQLYRETDGGLG